MDIDRSIVLVESIILWDVFCNYRHFQVGIITNVICQILRRTGYMVIITVNKMNGSLSCNLILIFWLWHVGVCVGGRGLSCRFHYLWWLLNKMPNSLKDLMPLSVSLNWLTGTRSDILKPKIDYSVHNVYKEREKHQLLSIRLMEPDNECQIMALINSQFISVLTKG